MTGAAAPLVVAADMGYGHLRAAWPIAEALGVEVREVDRPPLAGAEEERLWARTRAAYELTSRLSQWPVVGAPLRAALDAATAIEPLHPLRDLSAATGPVRALERLLGGGKLGQGLVEELRRSGAPLVTTFYTPALAADRAGCRGVHCVVTDSDLHRIWAPAEPATSRIRYLAPTPRAVRRLVAYGVPRERVVLTGFPLPDELVGGPELPALTRNLAARLVRLDPEREFRRDFRHELSRFLGPLPDEEEGRPPLLVFAVGGAGAQAGLAASFLPGFRPALEAGRLRLALVAGLRREVGDAFREAIDAAGLGALPPGALELVEATSFGGYYRAFNGLLARADALWTKPSELSFYAALGLPVICAWPVGAHEKYNRRWLLQAGAGLKQGEPRFAAEWLPEWLADGTLAGAAFSGFLRLPKFGLYRILEELRAAARPA
ncbi:glycosyltransferase family protein [Anaeromyxobacter paludicola]|uniref:Uncharacterized protein n=1 Tax=Anaeromyxobacter paludicola TaxID=2918171 RepID=A0ABM7XBS8_9BACT|nr:hypothetical protein [Anaeromyxobacter paludicola]BDG09324.1 hypothetical protein AMPC_24370 [Anaeromyxobacter paludicola]